VFTLCCCLQDDLILCEGMAGNGGLNASEEAARGEPALILGIFAASIGPYSNAVDIFNVKSGTWTTAVLSVARMLLSATSLPNDGLAIFAGGAGALFLHYVVACRMI
jgi:hypothetical protein